MIDRRDVLKLALARRRADLAGAGADRREAAHPYRIPGYKGGPRVATGASNPANLVMVNDTPYVIDCGMGVSRQLVAAGVPIRR